MCPELQIKKQMKMKKKNHTLARFATCNVKTLLQNGKLEKLIPTRVPIPTKIVARTSKLFST